MKKVTISFLFAFWLFVGFSPNFVSAENIFVSGNISVDTTWVSSNVYVINSSFSVAPGVTLTISPGTVIKARATGVGGPSIYGSLIALGTEENPIIFTSSNDDSFFGSLDEYPSSGLPGDWQGLYFKPGSVGRFDYVHLSYAGYGGSGHGNFVGIENDGGNVEIKNSKIFDNHKIVSNGAGGVMTAGSGIWNKSGDLSVQNSLIENSMVGVRVDSGNISVSGTTFKKNIDSTGQGHGYGIYTSGSDSLTLLNNVFEGNKRTAHIRIAPNFVHSGNVSSDETNRGFEIDGDLSGEVVLSGGDMPYILGHIIINSSGKLTVSPGAILKMNDYVASGAIYVNGGTLEFPGTPENKIYITSLRDDTIGGDTNGDGDLTLPALKNWASIFLENGSNALFENVELGYGGYNWNGEYLNIGAAIYQRGAELSIKNSVFHHNRTADIFTDGGNTQILDTEFNGSDYGIWSRGGSITVSKSSFINHVGLGVYGESGPRVGAKDNWWGASDGPRDTSNPNPTGNGDKIQGNVNYTPFLTSWPPSTEKVINPVIIVPGIMGSAYKNGNWVIDPVFHVYDNLIETLEKNGYTKGENLFPWGYDWKNSNTESALLLKQKIDEIKNICGCEEVDIVAHSMGGLVTRAYVQSENYENDIDQIIFLGTPHRGAPKDYLTWEAAELSPDAFNFFIESHYKKEAKKLGYDNLFDYIHDWPIKSVEELLPTSNYLYSATSSQTLIYPTGYPRNIFLENLNQGLVTFLEEDIDIANIISKAKDTITGLRVVNSNKLPLWQHGYPENYDSNTGDKGLIFGLGDGTVPEISASLGERVDIFISSDHVNLPTDAMEEIFAEIHGGELVDPVKTSLPLKILFAKIFSPADFVVIAPDGKKVGKDFATGQEVNEIPGAFYSGFEGDDEYVTISDPLDGEYKIELQGTGMGGSYSFETTYITEATSTTAGVSGVTAPNQITNLKVGIDSEKPNQTKIEKEVTLDVLISDINMAYSLGWIKDVKVKNDLVKKAKLLIKFEKRRNGKYEKVVDRLLVVIIDKELDLLLKKGKINKDARDLLRKDLKYIINNN